MAPNGSFQSVSKSVPGSVHDLTLLRQSDLPHRLPRAEGVMLDKGYDGLQRLDPMASSGSIRRPRTRTARLIRTTCRTRGSITRHGGGIR